MGMGAFNVRTMAGALHLTVLAAMSHRPTTYITTTGLQAILEPVPPHIQPRSATEHHF